MKAAITKDIRKEIEQMPPDELKGLVMRLARKKENKELLTYLLFESNDEEAFAENLKEELLQHFQPIDLMSTYYVKKSLRKTIKFMDKYLKFSGKKETEVDVRLYFCESLKKHEPMYYRDRILLNLYNGQLKKINAALEKIHEDLQYEYQERWHAVS